MSGDETKPGTRVYLFWMNDSLLGVYSSLRKAKARASETRLNTEIGKRNAWTEGSHSQTSIRWYQPDGPIARLEIETRTVS